MVEVRCAQMLKVKVGQIKIPTTTIYGSSWGFLFDIIYYKLNCLERSILSIRDNIFKCKYFLNIKKRF